jgi:hypothetical protein
MGERTRKRPLERLTAMSWRSSFPARWTAVGMALAAAGGPGARVVRAGGRRTGHTPQPVGGWYSVPRADVDDVLAFEPAGEGSGVRKVLDGRTFSSRFRGQRIQIDRKHLRRTTPARAATPRASILVNTRNRGAGSLRSPRYEMSPAAPFGGTPATSVLPGQRRKHSSKRLRSRHSRHHLLPRLLSFALRWHSRRGACGGIDGRASR